MQKNINFAFIEPGFNSDIDALDAFQSEGRRLHQIAFLGDAKIAAEEYCNGLALYIKVRNNFINFS